MKWNQIGKIATQATEGKLFSCKSVFPFKLFPDEIILDNEKITIKLRSFLNETIETIQIIDLSSIKANTGPVFANVQIYSKYVTTGEYTVNWLRRHDALKLRDLANSLMTDVKGSDAQSGGQ